MIRNAAEAREIVAMGVIPGDIDSIDLAHAKGYLAALEGPEVRGLLEALEEVAGGVDYYEEPHDAMFIAEKALAAYHQAVQQNNAGEK